MGRFLAGLGIVVFAAALLAPAAGAKPPPGNNGTVKVDGADIGSGHDNDPHVGCAFDIEWFGFDEGLNTSTVTFTAQPPTAHGDVLLSDEVTFSGNGSGNTLDNSETYDLTSKLGAYEPQPNQGYHVKLTVNTPGTQGADVKHKTFWVSGCEPPTPPPAVVVGSITLDKVLAGSAPTTDPSFTFTVTCESADATVTSPVSIKASEAPKTVASGVPKGTACTIVETAPGGGVTTTWSLDGGAAQAGSSLKVTVNSATAAAVVATNTYPAPTVAGEEITQQPQAQAQAQAQVEAEQLARTGTNSALLAVIGLALLLGGVAVVQVSRKFEPTR